MKTFLLSILFFLVADTLKVKCQNPLTDSLIANYPLDGNALDATGNGNNGTVYGATLTIDRFGNANAAYSFDGINDYIEYTTGNKFKPADFPVSFTCWIKSNDSYHIGPIFKNDAAPDLYTGISLQVQVSLGGILELHYGDGGTTGPTNRRSKMGTIDVNDNQWHFVAGVIRGATDMDLYIDCDYDPGYYSGSGGSLTYSNANGNSGVYDVVSGTYYYEGKLDELRFYHRELTLTDLQIIYSYPNPYGSLSVSLGADTSICYGSALTLIPVTSGNIQSYLWSDSSQSSSFTVTEPGSYYVTVFDGCSYGYDTIHVEWGKPIALYLPNDTIICAGQTFEIEAGNFYDSYLWSTGETTSSISVTDSGWYTLTVELAGCTASDSILVSFVVCTSIDEPPVFSGIKMFYYMESHIVEIINTGSDQFFDISVEVINLYGQTILKYPGINMTNNLTFSLRLPDNLEEGLYIVNVKSGIRSEVRSVIENLRVAR